MEGADRRWKLNLTLFVATLATTLLTGIDHRRIEFPEGAFEPGGLGFFGSIAADPSLLVLGVPFAGTLMAILVFHEAGHYIYSRIHRVRASLPYFIPFPTVIGTMGAIIVMRGRIGSRLALLDIGAAGPIAGFVLAVPALLYGVATSTTIENVEGGGLLLGESLLVRAAIWLVGPERPPDGDIVLSPIALAAWFGLFLTSFNLMPVGQFDGGHVLYAVLGPRPVRPLARIADRIDPRVRVALATPRPTGTEPVLPTGARARLSLFVLFLAGGLHRVVGFTAVLVVVVLGLAPGGWVGWLILALLAWRFFHFDHDPTRDDRVALDRHRRAVAAACLVIFALTFTPFPFQLTPVP